MDCIEIEVDNTRALRVEGLGENDHFEVKFCQIDRDDASDALSTGGGHLCPPDLSFEDMIKLIILFHFFTLTFSVFVM